MTWCNRFKYKKAFKKELSKELMLVACILKDGGIAVCQKMKREK